MTEEELRTLIIADDPLSRAGLATLLETQSGCQIVGQISSDANALINLAVYQPDVILWDLGWNAEEALANTTEVIEAQWPVVVLLPDETLVAEAWGIGLRGLLLRNATPETLSAALMAVAKNLIILDEAFVNALALPNLRLDQNELIEDLTPRESEVLQLLAEGLTNKAIAHQLEISDHTVKFHVNAIMGKLGAQSRTEAVVQATRLGLILL